MTEQTLEQVLNFIHNYFEKDIVKGTFTVSDGVMDLPFIKEGQYFRIVGSIFNDGIYKHPASLNADEVFEGEIWAMAVPPAVIAISVEIEEWINKYSSTMNSPFQSESFGGYSYTKKSSGGGGNSSYDPSDWRNLFRSRLNQWRKIS